MSHEGTTRRTAFSLQTEQRGRRWMDVARTAPKHMKPYFNDTRKWLRVGRG